MANEKEQIERFIEDSRNAGYETITYQMYHDQCLNNNEKPVESGRFNAIILTTFGFSWTREKGYKIE